jgi:membrane protein implicated in regulation of membrane protease activity
MTGQTKRGSFAEACLNVAIGYGVALASQVLIFPLYGVHLPLSTNALIGVWFTIISIARSYLLRRWFNRRTVRA